MSNRFAIVTGASSGIGKATAQVLAERGYDVGLTYGKNVDGIERTAEAVRAQGQRAFVAQMQLEAPDSLELAIEQLSNELGGLDALVNNAGLLDFQSFLDLSLDHWWRVLYARRTEGCGSDGGTVICSVCGSLSEHGSCRWKGLCPKESS
jgi:NAD(P)-dependent dehydrogenase (short-subunit alcohol dehydrogenase family)